MSAKLALSLLLVAVVVAFPSVMPPMVKQHIGAAQLPQVGANVTAYCTSRNLSATLPCQPRILIGNSIANFSQFYIYNSNPGYLNHMKKIESWPGIIKNKINPSAVSLPSTDPSNEIYRTAHWIWYADPTIYSQNKQYIDPYLNWPETVYNQISSWLGFTLPPGSYDGGRYAVIVDSTPGYCQAWSSGSKFGLLDQDFQYCQDFTWVASADEIANVFTGSITASWPADWWADGRSPFPTMLAVQVEKANGIPSWSSNDQTDSADPAYVMFRDALLTRYGWSLFQNTFAQMLRDGVNLANWHSEYESQNWYSLHYLKSHIVAYYLSRAAGIDLSNTLNQDSVGQYPPLPWNGCCQPPIFYPYQINLASVIPIATIQSPSGTQRGTINLAATASDPDWGVSDVTFWYSTDDTVFYLIGKVTSSVGGVWSVSWNTAQAIPGLQNEVWVMAVAHDPSGVESPWSVSSPFTVDNRYFVCTYVNPNSIGATFLLGGNPYSDGQLAPIIVGTYYSLQAQVPAGYSFAGWTVTRGTVSVTNLSSPSTTVIFGSGGWDGTCVGNLSVNYYPQITIASNPSGSGFVLVDGTPHTTPVTFAWQPTTIHTLSANSQVNGGPGCQSLWLSWSDGGGQPHQKTKPSTATTFTANYGTQYYLTVNSAYDSPNPTSGWFNAGTLTTASVTSPVNGGSGTQYVCTGWLGTGSVPSSGSACSVGFTINSPSSITWNWKTQYYLTAQANPTSGGTVSPSPTWQDSGSNVRISATPNSGWRLRDWTGTGSGSCSGSCSSVTMNGPIAEVANFQVQITITSNPTGSGFVTVDGSAIATPQSYWWDPVSSHVIAANSPVSCGSGCQYSWMSWNDGGGQSHSITASSAATTYTATFQQQYSLTVSSVYDSPNPGSEWLNAGSSVTASVSSPVSGGSGTQYVCTGWSGTGSVPSSGSSCSVIFTLNAPSSIIWNWKTQYYLSMQASPSNGGIVTPSSGWEDSGVNVPISATANAGWVFTGWAGTGSGSCSGSCTGVTMNGPITETANFVRVTTTSLFLTPSTISLGSPVTFSGSIVQNPGAVQVTVSFSQDSGATWNTLMLLMTDNSGSYSTSWTPPYPGSYLLKVAWSGNNQLAGSTSSPASLTITGTATRSPTLLLSAPSTGARGQTIRLLITVFNPANLVTTANVTIEITGPGNYIAFEIVQLKVAATPQSTAYYDWAAPNQAGTYGVVVSLLPATPTAFDAGTIQIT